jgi:Gpi18-like mannosyltransferase
MLAVRMAMPGEMGTGYVQWPSLSPETPPGLWLRWDANYYLVLARDGYDAHANMHGFFPLYPLFISALSGITAWSGALSGMLIAQASYLAAILGFYKLARLIRDDHGFAMWSVAFMLLFPSAFFFYALYAESLYLAFAIWGIYLIMRTRANYIGSGLLLALASLTRPVGWLLNMIVVLEYWFRRKTDRRLTLWRTILTVALALLGTVVFVAYLYSLTGTITAITDAQKLWGRHWNWPWTTLWLSIQIVIMGSPVPSDWFLYAINLADLLVTLLALSLTGVALYRSARGRFPWSLALYLVASLAFTLTSEGPHYVGTELNVVPLWGMTRWVSALFPIFLVMGDLFTNRRLRWAAIAGSTVLLSACTAWWVTGRWIG